MRIFSSYLLFLFFFVSSIQESFGSPFSLTQAWDDLGDQVNTFKDKILKDVTAEYASITDKISDFKKTMNQVITSAEALETMILKHIPNREEFQNQFEIERSLAWETLKEEFSEPLPENQTERYKQQSIRIAQALNMTEEVLVKLCSGLPEVDVRTSFNDIKPHINSILLIMVNFVDNHPVLFETLLLSVVISMIPETFILRQIFVLFGFGPLGPVKGSFAAFAQRFFFGAAVREASWFATLQRAGMKLWL